MHENLCVEDGIMEKIYFGENSHGQGVYKYSIENKHGMRAVLTDIGAAVVELWIKDKNNKLRDVALGYDEVKLYETEGTYFGATVGRYANRIADAKVEIDGVEYVLDANDNENTLHSGKHSMGKKVWSVKEHTSDKIVFTYTSPHLEQGFPGNAICDVT